MKFEGVARFEKRDDILVSGGAYSINKNQKHVLKSLSQMSVHLVKESQYGFLEPKSMIIPKIDKAANFSLLNGKNI